MSVTDRFTRKARTRLEDQLTPGEHVIHSATIGPVGMVLTDRRLMLAPYVRGIDPDVNLTLSAIHNVTWQCGWGQMQGTLEVHTSSQTFTYMVPKKQGEPAVKAIRQAIAAR
jgi:hypothetical protein